MKIVTKIASNDNQTKLKSLDVTESISDYQYQKNLMKDFIDDNKNILVIKNCSDKILEIINKETKEYIKEVDFHFPDEKIGIIEKIKHLFTE